MKKLVLFTILGLVCFSIIGLALYQGPPKKVYSIRTEGQPTVGFPGAPVHIVIFEEPKCSDCKRYNEEVFPMIKEEYIDTHKVLYTVIPVSFLPNSMPAAVALLCAYHQDRSFDSDNLFFLYLDYMYRNQPPEATNWATVPRLVDMAKKASPLIDTSHLAKCIQAETYRYQILDNTNYGNQLLGGHLMTPTVFVNGVIIDRLTKSDMQDAIEEALKQQQGWYVERSL